MLETKLEQEKKEFQSPVLKVMDEVIRTPVENLDYFQQHMEFIYRSFQGTNNEKRFAPIYTIYTAGDVFSSKEELNEQLINFKRNNLKY